MADGADPSLVDKFVSITGASESRARALLNDYNGNLEMAIGVYLEEGNGDAESSESQMANPNYHTNMGEDNVRAPIPQTRGVLLEGPYRANRPRQRGNQSVFDAFRDFQAEAREQELESFGGTCKSKRKTLQDLFKPPLDIMHKGTFDTAKVAGEQEGKWLMVNIQDSKEFRCQQLNRDVWSNDAVRSIMTNHFILWQVYHDSDDGDRYSQFYHVSTFPHLAILDPRTGEKMIEWDGIDAQTFCENATEFLSHHSLGYNTISCLSPPAKRRKRESIVDASEDSQLEAAIAASLKETSTELCSTKTNDLEKQVDYTGDDDSLTEFTDSESDTGSTTLAKNGKDNMKDIEDSVNVTESEKKPNKNSKDCEQNDKDATKQNDKDATKQKQDHLESDEDDLDSGCLKPFLMLRFPNGRRKQKSFPTNATLLDLVKYVQTQGFSNERYELVTNFPRKKLSYLDSGISLKDAGLFPRETVFIQER